MTRVQRSADQRQRHFCCKMDRLNVTRKLRAPRRHERLDILETFFEQNETLSDALRNSFLAIRDSQHTLQAFYEFKEISRQNLQRPCNAVMLTHYKRMFLEPPQKKVLVFVRNFVIFDLECRCPNHERFGRKIT